MTMIARGPPTAGGDCPWIGNQVPAALSSGATKSVYISLACSKACVLDPQGQATCWPSNNAPADTAFSSVDASSSCGILASDSSL